MTREVSKKVQRPLDALVVLGALIFLANVGVTIAKAKRWTVVQGSLVAGLLFLSLLYLFSIPFYRTASAHPEAGKAQGRGRVGCVEHRLGCG